MKAQLRAQAIRLRLDQNLGYASIAKLVPVAKSTLSNWLRHYPLSESRIKDLRRQNLKNSDAKIEAFRNTMRFRRQKRFEIKYDRYAKEFTNLSRQARFTAGLMLYLAEGSKTDLYVISLANTNPDTIKFFVKWANDFLNIPKEDFKFQLHLYETMDMQKEINFWKRELGVTDGQFYKHQIRKLTKTSFSYRESFRHGTCAAKYSSSEKKQELSAAIKAFTDSFLK